MENSAKKIRFAEFMIVLQFAEICAIETWICKERKGGPPESRMTAIGGKIP